MQQRYRGRGTIAVSRPLFCYQYNPLNILLIVNHRRAASADCIEMRADKYFAVWLELNAAIFIGAAMRSRSASVIPCFVIKSLTFMLITSPSRVP